MKVLSLFSGVGGFDLGLERAGMETVFQCEWDKHATKILERHWPDVPRWGDVSTLTGAHVLQHAPVVDVVAWGSPCQDLSVAGKRAGLGGKRSGLFHEGVRIIKEMREITNGKYPRISIWENVAGALSSSDGADFGQVLYEMDEAGACFSEWRLLDAQYFGVPQRRRRVFLVSVFDPATAARCPDPLLPVSESVRRDTEEGAKARQEPAGTPIESVGNGSEPLTFTKSKRAQTVDDNETWVEDQPAPTLNAFDQGDTRATTVIAQETVATLLTMREGKPGGGKGPLLSENKSLSLSTSNEQTLFQPTESVSFQWVGDRDNPSLATSSELAYCLNANAQSKTQSLLELPSMAVRRLTPIECERLMGWPDGWTDGQADTHRYKQCGNGVASPVATWIGQQLMELDR